MNTILSQGVYDSLEKSLARNAKALKDAALHNLHSKLLSGARTTKEGVIIPTRVITLSLTSIKKIVARNGAKYPSLADELLIDDLTEALSDGSFASDTAAPMGEDIDQVTSASADFISAPPPVTTFHPSVAPQEEVMSEAQEELMSEAFNFPPTPTAGQPTGRPSREYPTFIRNFEWTMVNLGLIQEDFLDVRKHPNVPAKRIDYDGSFIADPVLSKTILQIPDLFD